MIRFWPRKPRFPIIIDTGLELIGAKTSGECTLQLSQAATSDDSQSKDVIDATAEGFGFYPDMMIITPLTLKKKWTKREIVELYNSRREAGAPEYPMTSLGNKTVKRVVTEIVHLLSSARGTAKSATR